MFPPMREQSKFEPNKGILGRLELCKTPSSDNDQPLFTRYELFNLFRTGNSATLGVLVIQIALLPVLIWSTKCSVVCVTFIF